jgi:endoglucanase
MDHPHANEAARLALALELTGVPTASGREHHVLAYLDRWLSTRPHLCRQADPAGNWVLTPAVDGRPLHERSLGGQPLFITGHLDHPAFVVERVVAPGVYELSFRGGVMEVFFDRAPVVIHASEPGNPLATAPVAATITERTARQSPAGQHYLAEADAGREACVGDIVTWRLDAPEIDPHGLIRTHACDDLAAVAAALCAIDELAPALIASAMAGRPTPDVRVLLTRAEEIGFVGAIAACKHATMPVGSRVVALENSRAFPESPVGGGPIVRVGDRMSVFTPWLTDACAKRAEEVFGGPSLPKASETAGTRTRPWQRKLMAGGACEASVFCHSGYDATCICLPLGNYHNMPHLAELQAGTYDRAALGPPRAACEYVHKDDYLAMIDLLVALGERLPEPGTQSARFEKLYTDRAYVLA